VDPIGVVSNPHSKKNRRDPRRVERLRRIVGDAGEIMETRELGELRPTLRRLLSDGATLLVSDGGDGALHWMHNELLAMKAAGELGDEALPSVLPTNGGTIDFVARKAGIRGGAESILGALMQMRARGRRPPIVHLESLRIDGSRRTTQGESRSFERVGFAMAAGGVGQRFFDKYYASAEPGAGTILSIVAKASSSQLLRSLGIAAPSSLRDYSRQIFEPTRARVRIDGLELVSRRHGALHAGAFDVQLGGVFRVFPLARTPGRMHFQAGEISPWQIIRNLPRLAAGEPIEAPRMHEAAGEEMRIEAEGEELLCPVVDGEILRDVERLRVRRGPAVRIAQVAAS